MRAAPQFAAKTTRALALAPSNKGVAQMLSLKILDVLT
jgi:hypothetical protein